MSIKIKKGEEGFWSTFEMWPVTEDWRQELYNYFMCGFRPGSFHTSCYANDLMGAANHTHISNKWTYIVEFMKWLQEYAPAGSCGSYENVQSWLELDTEARNEILIAKGWKLTDKDLTWKIISED